MSIVLSLVSTNWMPRTPFINGHIDLWYAIPIAGIFFIKSLDIKLLFVIALPFGMMISELNDYAGMYDYFLETGFPLLFMAIFIPISYIKNWFVMIAFVIIGIGAWDALRFLGQTYAGVHIWGSPWKASAIYNAPNAFGDLIAIYPLTIFLLIFVNKNLLKISKVK